MRTYSTGSKVREEHELTYSVKHTCRCRDSNDYGRGGEILSYKDDSMIKRSKFPITCFFIVWKVVTQ